MRTVIALYDDFATASDAVRDLVESGFSRDSISLMASDETGQYGQYLDRDVVRREPGSGAAEGAGVGAGIGAVIGGLGGLLIGLGALTIPGIGPVIAAGPLAAALSGLAGAGVGAVAGGVTGGLLGALVDMGVPEETAHYYTEGVRRGGTLVTIRTSDEMSDRAVDILNAHSPVDMNSRTSEWRQSGWSGVTGESTLYEDQDYANEPYTRTTMPMYADFDEYDTRFRNHYNMTYTGTEYTYDQYLPAYRYGYDLATDERYRSENWETVEPEARRYWNERNPGTWERFKNAVRHAWEEVKDTVS